MDEDCKLAVSKMFIKLHNDGLIYRCEKMVNYDPIIRSAISVLEVDEKEVYGNIWFIKYKFEGSNNKFFEVTKTSPETIFGDATIAVHKNDKR